MPLKEANQFCPFCQSPNEAKFLQDARKKNGQFSLYECPNCGGQYWAPFSHPGSEWYQNGDIYNIKPDFSPRHIHFYHKYFLKVHPQLTDKIILDLGCGTGEFLNEVKKIGGQTYGVDIDQEAIKIAKHFFKLDHLENKSIEEFLNCENPIQYDYITLFEVFEHTDNPVEIIKKAKQSLKPEGLLVLSVPSRERILANLAAWDYPFHHLSRWSGKALKKILELNDFTNVKIIYLHKFGQLTEVFLDLLADKLHFQRARKFKKDDYNKSPGISKLSFKIMVKKMIIKMLYKPARFVGVKLMPRILAATIYPALLLFYPRSGVMYIEANKK